MSHLALAFMREAILPFFPVKSPRSHFFWNPELHAKLWSYTPVMIVVLCFLYWSFRRRWNLLLLLGSAIAGGTLLGHLVYQGSERQMGLTFLAFVGASWILRAAEPARLLPWPIYVLLAISALSSFWAVMESWQRPFSYNEAAAAWIVHNHLEQMPLVGESDTSAISVAEIMHRPVYMIECSCVDTYLLFSSRRDNFTDADAPARILQAEHFYHDQPLLFMRVFPMKPEEKQALEAEGFEVQPVKTFKESEEYGENFYFFRLTLDHAAAKQ
jgi:hypothetical protein